MTQTRLVAVTSRDQLNQLLLESASRPVLLFKHSRSCGTSAQAYDELLDHLAEHVGDDGPALYAVITVQSHRDVSDAATEALRVRHETPQALLLRHGRVVWAASHYRVTAATIAAAVKAALAEPVTPPTPVTS
jgi:bacillithiol system protein YtxJ